MHQRTVQDLLDSDRGERDAQILSLWSMVNERGAISIAPEGKPGTDVALCIGSELKELFDVEKSLWKDCQDAWDAVAQDLNAVSHSDGFGPGHIKPL